MTSNNRGRFVSALVAGAIAGAAVGVFVAPKPGKEAREIALARAGDCVTALRERLNNRQIAGAPAPASANGALGLNS